MRLAFVPTELVQAFTVPRLVALAEARGVALAAATDDEVAAALDRDGELLGDALAVLSFLLLDPAGERAFDEAARATGHVAHGPSYEDRCLALACGDAPPTRKAWARVAAASTRASTLVTSLLLACDGPRHLAQLGALDDLRVRLAASLAQAFGGAARVHVSRDGEGVRAHATWDAPSRRGQPRVVSAALSFRPGQPTARVFLLRAHAAHDVVRALSKGVFERDDALTFAPLVDLRPLQRLGTKALSVPRSFSHVSEARLIAYEWDSGDDDHQRSTGHDTLRTNERRGHRLDAGTMTWAKIRLTFVQPALRCDVELRRGSVFDVSEPRVLDEVRRLCAFWGLLDEKGAARDARRTLFELEPWSHPDAVWSRAFGAEEVDRLLAHALLVPITSRVVAVDERRDAGRVLVTLPIDGEETWWGVSDDPTIASRDVSLADRRTLWLDLRALGARLARGLGTSTPTVETLARGVVDLGHRKLGVHGLRFVLLARSLGVGRTARSVLDTLRRAALPHPLVVLVPPGCDGGTGLLEVPLSSLASDGRDELRRSVVAAGLDDHVTALELAPPGTRVVLCRRTTQLFIDGVRVELVGGSQLACLDALAERAGQPMSTDDLGRKLSPHGDPSGTAREAKRNLLQAVARALAAEGRATGDVKDMIMTSKGRGYWLAWSSWIRDA